MRFVLVLLLSLLSTSLAQAAEKVIVRGGQHEAFARMVFDWEAPTGFQARVEADRLIVTFDRPADYDFTDVVRRLFANLSEPSLSPDGRVLTFPVKGIATAKAFTLGPKVVVDLAKAETVASAPSSPAATPAASPAAPSAANLATAAKAPEAQQGPQSQDSTKAQPTPKVQETGKAEAASAAAASTGATGPTLPVIPTRLGEHPKFDRLVFDWPETVGYRLNRKGDEVEVLFDRPARLDLRVIERERPQRLTAASSQLLDKGIKVTLRIPIDSQVKGFTDGTKVVVDVYSGDQVRRDPDANKPVARPASKPPAGQEVAATPPPAPEKSPAKTVAKTKDAPPAEQPARASNKTPAKRPAVPTAAPAKRPGDPGPPTALIPPLPPGGLAPLTPAEAVAEGLRRDFARVGSLGEPPLITGEAAVPAPVASGLDLVRTSGPAGLKIRVEQQFEEPNLAPVPGQIAPWPDPVKVYFDWDAPVGMALFKVGREIVLAFDQLAPVGAERRVKRDAVELAELTRSDSANGTIFRLPVSGFIVPSVTREGDSWVVDLRSRPLQQDQEIRVFPDTNRKRVIFDVVGAYRILTLLDPATGEDLYIVPLMRAGQAIFTSRRYPEFSVRPTSQGLVLQRHTDGIEVAVVKGGVEVSGRDGLVLALSERGRGDADTASDAEVDGSVAALAPVGPRLFDLEAWRVGPAWKFNEIRQELQSAVVQADRRQKGLARLKLAQFYFAQGFASEALGVLSLVNKNDPELYGDPQVILLEAASRTLNGDYDKARELLEKSVFVGEVEAELWRGVLAAAAQEWDVAAPKLAATEALFGSYPRSVRQKLRLLSADAQIAVGALDDAERLLTGETKDFVSRLEKAERAFLLGQLDYANGNSDAALERWRSVAGRNAGAASARARLALIDSEIKAGKLSAKAAIEKLEQLRFAWRGDDFEFALLIRLANLYTEDGQNRESLLALRRSATYFPGRASSERAAQRMSREFERLFIKEEAKSMAPLAALSLYEEFRELTPPGKPGDDLIANIADRLVDVDLLDRAAALLEHQIKFRLTGPEKALVGSRLAVVRLLDRKPRKALAALESSQFSPLSDSLIQERKYLSVRALADIGQTRKALALLGDDQSRSAAQLKAEIFWRSSQWQEAAQALAATLPPPPAEDQGLSDYASAQVINLSVALTLAGQEKALKELAGLYGQAMLQGPHADAFTLLAGQGAVTGGTSITAELAKVERVQAFMANYRAKLTNTPLSAIN